MTLSAVIAARDEEQMLPGCLRLLDFADEIVVVVDARSSDRTHELARAVTEHVHEREFDDFASQKNFAIEQATGDWVLIVDADERVTPGLAAEIERCLRTPEHDAYEIRTLNCFLGRPLLHGGWTEWHTRLVRRDRARYTDAIHESFGGLEGPVGRLEQPMWHFSHRTIEDMLRKTVNFGGVQARDLYERGAPRVTGWTLARTIVREFLYRMVRRRGYRDGMEGAIEAIYQPFSLFCVQVMLWQLQRRPSIPDAYMALEARAQEAW